MRTRGEGGHILPDVCGRPLWMTPYCATHCKARFQPLLESVRLSVCHSLILCQNGANYRQAAYATL